MRKKLQLGPWAWLAIGMVVVCFWHIHMIDRNMPQNRNDLLPRWVGIRAAMRGEDPYSAGALREMQTAYYGRPLTAAESGIEPQGFYHPAYAVIVLGPFALLPWSAARLLFLVIAPLMLAAGFWFWARELKGSTQVAWIATCLTLASWPMMWALRLQQPTLLTAAFVFIAYAMIVRGRDIPAGILLAASTIKPQLVGVLILWLFLWAVLQRRYRLLASFVCAMAALLIPTEILVPDWFPRWIHSVAAYPHNGNTAFPLILGLGHSPGQLLTVALVSMSAFFVWKLRSVGAQSPLFGFAFSLLLAVALCVTPTKLSMVYNQVLLAPAAVILACWNPKGYVLGVTRCMALLPFVWGFMSVLIAVAGETIWGPSEIWIGLPFKNLLLPAVASVALLIRLGSCLRLPDFFCNRWNHLEEIPDHADVGDLEDRGLGVLIDGHNSP